MKIFITSLIMLILFSGCDKTSVNKNTITTIDNVTTTPQITTTITQVSTTTQTFIETTTPKITELTTIVTTITDEGVKTSCKVAPISEEEINMYQNAYTFETPLVSNDYFRDTIFVGDSIGLMLLNMHMKYKNTENEFLPNAKFLVMGNFSVNHAISPVSENSVHPYYQGEKTTIEDALYKMNAKRVYIFLGMNDVMIKSHEDNINNYQTLINRIKEKNADIEIYIGSITPVTIREPKGFTNLRIDLYNKKLLKLASENHIYYSDVNSYLKGDNGCIPYEYTSERFIHFSELGARKFEEYIKTHSKNPN